MMMQQLPPKGTDNYRRLEQIRILAGWAQIPDDPQGAEMRQMLKDATDAVAALGVQLAAE